MKLLRFFTLATFLMIPCFGFSNFTRIKNGILNFNGTKSNRSQYEYKQYGISFIQPLVVLDEVLWQSGQAGVNIYRCPLLTYTPGGNLLAIVEGRKASGDGDLKFIATRRSVDGGFKWLPENFIHDDGGSGDEDNLGVVLVDETTKEIFIFFVICPHPSECPGKNASVMYVKSSDDGFTWQRSVNVTAQAGPRNFAPGPGYGIQKKFAPHVGRLIVCGHGGSLEFNGNFCLLSDDHGKMWRWGAEILPMPAYTINIKGDFVPDECQPIELPDGSIMLNTRNEYQYHCNCRIVSMSYDGMETIEPESVYLDTSLVDPAVCASIISHLGLVFFTNPATKYSRTNMMLKWSYDNGKTWPGRLSIWKYASGYSCMTAFPESYGLEKMKYLYMLYENGKRSSTEMITFTAIRIDGSL